MARRRRIFKEKNKKQKTTTVRSDNHLNKTIGEIETLYNSHPKLSFRPKDILQELAQSPKHAKALREAMKELMRTGKLKRVKGKRLAWVHEAEVRLFQGILDVTAAGFGFVVIDKESKDIYIPRSKLRGAGNGDRVEVAVVGTGRLGKPQGRVVRILERDNTPVIGRFVVLSGRGGLVYPDNPRMQGPVDISLANLRGAKDGDRVQVEVNRDSQYPRGRVVRIFGEADDPAARYKALIAEHKFRESFAEGALAEADAGVEEISDAEWEFREDLRDRMIVTIDPDTAKDFDDAVSLQKLKNGHFELGVHIADVSWFVREGGLLDTEARMRGTSVYTSHGTLPMLPHRLSSDLCSLREGVERRTFSVFMEITKDAEIISQRIARSVIQSKKRLTYHEAQDYIEKGRERWPDAPPSFRKDSAAILIHYLSRLISKMRERRFESGGLNLEVPEYQVEIDETGEPVDIHPREVLESNRLVEECMLAANRAVTEMAVRWKGAGVKGFVFRVHDRPDPDRVEELAALVEGYGLNWTLGRDYEQISSVQLDRWLATLVKHPLADILRIHTLRAMSKAEYDVENIGHYGLGFSNYTHFTSPIRRYPDLEVHRILWEMLQGTSKYGPDTMPNLKRICMLSSERERAAQAMERQSLKIRQAEYFLKMIGEEFDAMITRVIPKGALVEIEGTGAQGMVLAEDLGAVYFDREAGGFVEIGGERLYRPGKKMKVRITEANPDLGRIEMEAV